MGKLHRNARIAALALVIGVACGSEERSDGPSREPVDALIAAAANAYQVRAGLVEREHTLVIGTRNLPRDLDPLGALDPWGQRLVDDLIFEGLTRRTGERFPFAEPQFADACVALPTTDARDVYCHLPTDRHFHDGTPVTSEDVLFSVEQWLDPRREVARLRQGLAELRKVELVDRPPGEGTREPGRWIHIAFERPMRLALEHLASVKILPRAAYRARGFGRAPVGTGPMRVVSMDADHIELERVEVGSGDDREIRRVVVRATPDRARALTQMRRGELQILDAMAPIHVPEELTKPGMAARFSAYVVTPPRFDLLLYNLRQGPQAGPRLRDALDRAIPFHAVDAVHGMPSAPAAAPVDRLDPRPIELPRLAEAGVSATWGVAGLPELAPDEDAEGASQAALILDELGWTLERGTRRRATGPLRTVLLWDGERGAGAEVAALVRKGWRDVGITVPHATASWAYVFGLLRKGEFDLALLRLGTRTFEDLRPYFHSRGVANLTGISDAELDAALEAYTRAQDRAERRSAQERIARRLADVRPVTVLYAPTFVTLVSKRVEELEFVDDLPRLDRLRLAPEATWVLHY